MPEAKSAHLPLHRFRTYRLLTQKVAAQRPGRTTDSWELSSQLELAIHRPDPRRPECDRLFIGHVEIARSRWKWHFPGIELSFSQGAGTSYLAGHFGFDHTGRRGFGTLVVGGRRLAVQAQQLGALYHCQVAANAGVSWSRQDNALKFDPESPEWQSARWSSALTFGYEVTNLMQNYVSVLGPAFVFKDEDTKQCWTPWVPPLDQQAPNLYTPPCSTKPTSGNVGYAFNFDADGALTFDAKGRYIDDARACAEGTSGCVDGYRDGIRSVFPDYLAFQFDPLALTFNGAMVVNGIPGSAIESGVQYLGVKGTAVAPQAVGHYVVQDAGGTPVALFSVHGGNLVLDGERVASSRLRGHRLEWTDLDQKRALAAGLPQSGSLELSPCGSLVRSSSFAGAGQRVSPDELRKGHAALLDAQPTLAASLATTSSPPPDPSILMGMNNFQLQTINGEPSYVDVVQQQAMSAFYQIIEYYMDPDLRKTFLSTSPISLDPPVLGIATDSTKNQAFYQALQIPLLVNALAQSSSDPSVASLNAKRAQAYLSDYPATQPEYLDQANKLYQYYWVQTFPDMQSYLNDQAHVDHTSDIAALQNAWITDIANQNNTVADPNNPYASLQEQEQFVQQVCQYASTHRLWWALQLYMDLTSNINLSQLQLLLASGNTSQDASLKMKQQTAVLNVLDPSGFYANNYANVLNSFNVANIMANWVDYGGNMANFTYAAQAILESYLATYVNSPDPDVAQAVRDINEALQTQSMDELIGEYASLFLSASLINYGGWSGIMVQYEKQLTILSKPISLLGYMFGMAMGLVAISLMIEGQMSWSDIPPTTQASIITGGVATLAYGAGFLIKGTMRAYNFFDVLGQDVSRTRRICQFFVKSDAVAAENISSLTNGFVRWLARGNTVSTVEAALLEAEGVAVEDFNMVTKFFGRSLDEFLATRLGAALAVVGLVLSAVNLAKATTARDKLIGSINVASAALALISVVASWSLAFVAAEGAAASVLTCVAELAGPLALVGLLLGVIVMFCWKPSPPPNPVQLFVFGEATDAGYYMTCYTIDYFAVDKDSTAGELSTGLSLKSASGHYLRFKTDGTLALGSLTNDWDTVFSLTTDMEGKASIFTMNDAVQAQAFILSLHNGALVGASQKDAEAPDNQLWVMPVSEAKSAEEEELPTQGTVQVQCAASSKYVVDNSGAPSLSASAQSWTLVRTATKPANLTYPPMELFMNVNNPTEFTGPVSAVWFLGQSGVLPYTFSVRPALPSFLQLDTASGVISVKDGAALMLMPQTTYTVTLSSQIDGVPKSTSAPFQLTVLDSRVPWGLCYPLVCIGLDSQLTSFYPIVCNGVGAAWSVTPPLPDFLMLDVVTGALRMTKVPKAIMAATDYTVMASNSYGSTSAQVTVQVVQTTAGGCP